MNPVSRVAALLSIPVLALSACGSDDTTGTATTAAGTASTTTAAQPATATPEQRLAALRTALAAVKSYRVKGTVLDEDGRTELDGSVIAGGAMRFLITSPKGTAELRLVGGKGYFNGDRATYERDGGAKGKAIADKVAGKWVFAPLAALGGDDLQRYQPARLARCLARYPGTLEDGGTGEVDGRPVTILKALGDAPGSSPGLLYIAADGPPLPLRATQTGPEQPGGPKDPACEDDEPDTTERSDVVFSGFDTQPPIPAPDARIDLEKVG